MFNGKRLSGWMALAVFATVGGAMVAADPAFAKTDVDKLTISGEIRERYEIRTNTSMNTGAAATGLANKGNESLASHRVRVGVGYDLTPDVAFFAQIADARNFGGEGGAVAGAGAAAVATQNTGGNGLDLHQGYINLKNVLVPGLSLKAGRQEIIFGDHRLFGNFAWSQIGNSFDGVRLTHSTQAADVDLFWARIVDTCAAGAGGAAGTCASSAAVAFPLTPNATNTSATGNQDIYGLYVTLKPVKNWTIEPYYFLLQDARGAANAAGVALTGFSAITTAQATGQSRNFLGGRVNGKQGGLDFTYEGNYQFGSIDSQCTRANGSTVACGSIAGAGGTSAVGTGTGRDAHINAHQHAVKTGFTFDAVPMKPRLGFEFNYASGDKCANGSSSFDQNNCGKTHNSFNTADNLYPTNHFHMGYMDLMSWKNMVNYQIMFDVKPSPVSKLQFNYIMHRLASTKDNWYRANQGAYFTSKASNQEASLGQELDVHYWHTFKEKFKFEVGFGHFFAGAYLDKSVGALSVISGGTQGSASNGLNAAGNNSSTVDQNWGYVMGSIIF